MKHKKDYKYLLHLYSRVDDYLTNNQNNQEELPDIVVSFCTVIEKIIKIKLHKKNPVLIFDNSKMKDSNTLAIIVNKKEKDIETIKIAEILARFKIIFKNIFSDDELQALLDIYYIRNNFIHGYKEDNKILFDEEDVIKKMGTIWDKISKQAIILFGMDSVKKSNPKKKYTEEELEKVLIEEVRTKIKSTQKWYGAYGVIPDSTSYQGIYDSYWGTSEKCPRCGSYGFLLENSETDVLTRINMFQLGNFSDLYKCKKCHLELTRKEYEIAKILNMEKHLL